MSERVFAYGSNMNLADLRAWLAQRGIPAGIEGVEVGFLPGWRLVWNYYSRSRDGGAANVERASGATLPGLVVTVDAVTFAAIDAKEGHPKYYSRGTAKKDVQLADGRTVKAWLYVAVPSRTSPTPVWPRRDYRRILIDAAKAYGLPDWHVKALEATPTLDGFRGFAGLSYAPGDHFLFAKAATWASGEPDRLTELRENLFELHGMLVAKTTPLDCRHARSVLRGVGLAIQEAETHLASLFETKDGHYDLSYDRRPLSGRVPPGMSAAVIYDFIGEMKKMKRAFEHLDELFESACVDARRRAQSYRMWEEPSGAPGTYRTLRPLLPGHEMTPAEIEEHIRMAQRRRRFRRRARGEE